MQNGSLCWEPFFRLKLLPSLEKHITFALEINTEVLTVSI